VAVEASARPSARAIDLLVSLVLLALGLMLMAAAQARLRQMAEDALARTLASIWLAARVEEWAASPYGSPLPQAAERLERLIAEAGLKAARTDFRLSYRVCLEPSCAAVDAFLEFDRGSALRWQDRPQWEEADFVLELELPSGRSERLAARLRRSPLSAGVALQVASPEGPDSE
jgi:hypothetical protein